MRPTRNDRATLAAAALAGAVALLGLCGCAHLFPDRTPEKVLASSNAYLFYENRYVAKCVTQTGPKECAAIQALLKAWKSDLEIVAPANPATKHRELRPGPIPLWLAALKADEANARRALK